ncbi:MAG: hypothetical protein KKG04_05565 [Candidatus Thermoplasmatota archaeon]|nr:hypothetical protein [Candidatus Thermoplasmatota archaeon]
MGGKSLKIRILLITIVVLILCSSFEVLGGPLGILKPRIRIVQVTIVNDIVVPNETFEVGVTVAKQRFRRFHGEAQVFLTNSGLIREAIGNQLISFCTGNICSDTFIIPCIINDVEAEWYQESYGIQVVVYEEIGFPIFGTLLAKRDSYTIESIRVLSQYWEKDKVTLGGIIVPETLEKDHEAFTVEVIVVNDGAFNYNATVRIDLVEKPSAIPQLEQLNLVEGLATIRKELGEKFIPLKAECPGQQVIVPCMLRDSEIGLTHFTIQAVLFVDIDEVKYQVDSSTYYEIDHEQSFLRSDNLPLIIGIIMGVLATIGGFFFFIRILYPLYFIKKNVVREQYYSTKKGKKK